MNFKGDFFLGHAVLFSCPGQLNRWPCHSLTHSLSQWVSQVLISASSVFLTLTTVVFVSMAFLISQSTSQKWSKGGGGGRPALSIKDPMNMLAAIDFLKINCLIQNIKFWQLIALKGMVTCEARNCKRINGQQRLFSLYEFTNYGQ